MTVEFAVPASTQSPAPDKMIAIYTAAFGRTGRTAVRVGSARQPRAPLDERQVMTAERRIHRGRRVRAVPVTAMRIRLASRAPTPVEQAHFNDLFEHLPSDDEG